MFKKIQKIISIAVLIAFMATTVQMPAYAKLAEGLLPCLPVPGVMVHLSPEFMPAHLQGMTIHPDNALQFDFLIHRGDAFLDGNQKKVEYKKLIKYFLASLTIPDEDQWVNLSPYEKDRIIKDDFGKTEMGRDLLGQDYILKQLTSSLIYPEENLGRKFWDKIYERAWREYHTTSIPVNTFNKVWIVPDQAMVYESGNSVYILKSHLKVMLEEDYLSLQKHSGVIAAKAAAMTGIPKIDTHSIGSQIIREIILPELEREVNTDKNFANLRQMYSGMILATWYKKALKESLLGRIYADKSKVKGVDQDPRANEEIYKRYLKAFKKGVFNYIKEDVDKYTHENVPRKYFSGGWQGLSEAMIVTPDNLSRLIRKQRTVLIVTAATLGLVTALSSEGFDGIKRNMDVVTTDLNIGGIAPKWAKAGENASVGNAAMTVENNMDEFLLIPRYQSAVSLLKQDPHDPSTDAYFMLDSEKTALNAFKTSIDQWVSGAHDQTALISSLHDWYKKIGIQQYSKGASYYDLSVLLIGNVQRRKAAFESGDSSLKNLPAFVRRAMARVLYGEGHYEADGEQTDRMFKQYVAQAEPTGRLATARIEAIKKVMRNLPQSLLTENELGQAVDLLAPLVVAAFSPRLVQKEDSYKKLHVLSVQFLTTIEEKYGNVPTNQKNALIYFGIRNDNKVSSVREAIQYLQDGSSLSKSKKYVAGFSLRREGRWRISLDTLGDNHFVNELGQHIKWLERMVDDVKHDRIPFERNQIKERVAKTVREINVLLFTATAHLSAEKIPVGVALARRHFPVSTIEGLADFVWANKNPNATGLALAGKEIVSDRLEIPQEVREKLISLYSSLGYFIPGIEPKNKAMTSQEIEVANFLRIQRLIDLLKEKKLSGVLSKVLINLTGRLYLSRRNREYLTPKQVLQTIEMDGYDGLKRFVEVAQDEDRGNPLWAHLLDKLRSEGQQGQSLVYEAVQSKMGTPQWSKWVASLKQQVLIADKPQQFFLETPQEVKKRLKIETHYIRETLAFLQNAKEVVKLEKSSGALQGALLRHLGNIFGKQVVEQLIERKWRRQQFYVPLYEFSSRAAEDTDREIFLANFARINKLVLVEQDGIAKDGKILGVKTYFMNHALGVVMMNHVLELFRQRQNQIEKELWDIATNEEAPDFSKMDVQRSPGEELTRFIGLVTFNAEKKPLLINQEELEKMKLKGWTVGMARSVMQYEIQDEMERKGSSKWLIIDGNNEFVVSTQKPRSNEIAGDYVNNAMLVHPVGGIDLNAVNMNLQIKRDGRGMPLPLSRQDMAQLSRIQGFDPEIIRIRPAVNLPILTELQQRLQAFSA